ncbi:MAG: Ig-like domain-containing protein, partial [Verrucomicrobia bacterium]|nr:Ig-like domain-containing protein [Verrucomicrobiota bacterium]
MKHLYVVAWFAWILSALGQGQINLNNRGLALVNDSTGKPLTGTTFVAAVLYGSSEGTISKAFLPSPFRASTTTYPGTWNPAAAGGPGTIATLSGFNPGSTVSLKVVVWDTAVFATWEAAAAALQANKSTVPTQAGMSSSFTYAIPADPLAIPGGLEKFAGLKLTALSNTGPANQAPTAVGQSLSVNSGQTLAITLAGTDPEGASLTYTVVNQPVSGTLAGTGVGRVYTPKAGFSGSDNFTFKVNDGSLDSAVVTVAISVKPVTVNQAPIADSQNLSVAVGEAKDIGLTAKDPENAKLTYTILTQPANGTLTGTAPALRYTPKTGFTGADSFTFKVNDGALDSALATISISVSEAGAQINLNNRGLALVNDAAGKPLVGATFAAKILYGASEAGLTQTFLPAPFRDATTTYPGTWNPAAVGGPGAIATLVGFKLGATVTLKVAVWDTAAFATWELAEAALKAGKSAVPTQAGLSAAFAYTVPTDSLAIPGGMEKFPGLKLTALSNTGPVNQAPTADSQTVSLATGESRDIGLTGRDPENAKLTYTILTQPANGTLTGIAPAIKYTPKAGFTGADSFTFKVNDGALDSALATISISVSEAGAQINLNNRGLALVNDAAGKPLVGATFAAKILYGA